MTGDVLVFKLDEEQERLEPRPGDSGGRSARALLKSGPLRVTVVALAPGGATSEHQAEGPITIQPIRGRIRFTAETGERELGPGELLFAEPGLRHAVASDGGAVFLLTVVKPENE
jgi:quercetin dioxygenase-like cupin family protein